MTNHPNDPEVMIGIGGAYYRVPLIAIAASIQYNHHALRDALSKLYFALSDRSAGSSTDLREPTEGDGSDGYGTVPFGSETVSDIYKENGTVALGTVPSETSEPSDAPACEGKATLSAAMLADLLDDAGSLPYYEQLLASVDHRHIHYALDETLRRRPGLRAAPGAYFTAVVRRLTHSPRPYA